MTLVQRRLAGLAVTVVLGGAAAGVALWQARRSETSAKEDAAGKKVIDIGDTKAVREVEITTPGGTFVLQREGTAAGAPAWAIVKPLRTPADGFAVDGLVGALADLERTASLGEKDEAAIADKARFGLAPPRFRVTLVTAEGKRTTLLAGDKNDYDGSLYVQREGRDEVLTVGGALEYQLDKDLFKLRDKRLTAFEGNEVAKLAVDVDGKPRWAVESTGPDTWKLTAPRPVAADTVEVSAVLSALSSASATSFVGEAATPADLARYGLDHPKARAVLTLRAGAPRTLLFSAVADKGAKKYYATLGVASPILELSSSWVLDKIAVDPDSLRDTHVLPFDREAVAVLDLEGAGKKLSFSRKSEAGIDRWSMTAPEAAKAQDATLEGLLYRLWNLKSKKIVTEMASPADFARLGLDRPSLTVTLAKSGGAKLGTFHFGTIDGEDQYVTTPGSRRIDVVESSLSKDVSLDAAKYRDDVTAKK